MIIGIQLKVFALSQPVQNPTGLGLAIVIIGCARLLTSRRPIYIISIASIPPTASAFLSIALSTFDPNPTTPPNNAPRWKHLHLHRYEGLKISSG